MLGRLVIVSWLLGLLILFDELADGLTNWLVDLVECFVRLRDWSTVGLLGCLVIVGWLLGHLAHLRIG